MERSLKVCFQMEGYGKCPRAEHLGGQREASWCLAPVRQRQMVMQNAVIEWSLWVLVFPGSWVWKSLQVNGEGKGTPEAG